jgi:sugar lactone lactonase YvrE
MFARFVAVLFLSCIALAAHAQGYERAVLVPAIAGLVDGKSPHGINGLNFGSDGALYGGSVISPGIYRYDVQTGAVARVVGAPEGEADDVAMGPDGTLVWTAILAGELRARRPDGALVTLATNLPMINPVNFTPDGRLLIGQLGQPDVLLEADIAGKTAPRVIAKGLGGINAFVGDGKNGLYVPLADKGAVGRVDLATGEVKIVATDLGQPVAVKMDSHGALYAIDWTTGKITFVNAESGETIRIATVTPPLDNLAVGPDDTIYVSRPSDNSIIAVDSDTGRQRAVIQGRLAAPGGLAVLTRNGKRALLVTDAFGYRFVDALTGETELLPFDLAVRASSAVAVTEDKIVLGYVRRPSVTVIDRATGRALHNLTGFKAPMGVAAVGEEIYVADYGTGEILKLMPGATPDRAVVAAGLKGPAGLARDRDGSLIVSEAGTGTLSRLDPATGARVEIASGLNQPEGLAVLNDGRIAVAEVGARRLTLVDPATGERRTVAEDLPIGEMFTRAPTPVFLPTGVATDETGAIYLTCDVDNTLLKFTPVKK